MRKSLLFILCFLHLLYAQDAPLLRQVLIFGEYEKEEESLSENIAGEFQGQPITEKLIQKIQAAIIQSFQETGDHLVYVSIPDQDVSNGVLRYAIKHPRVKEVRLFGNTWFSKKQFLNPLKLKEGAPLNERSLQNGLAWVNRNPFRRVEATLIPVEGNQVEIDLAAKDRFPVRFYVGADNTGTTFTSAARYYGGFTWGNLFQAGGLLSYQFTSGPKVQEFSSHTANLVLYTSGKRELNFYGGFSLSHPEVTSIKSEAKNGQASFRYVMPLSPLYTETKQEVLLGFDYKFLNSNVFFISEAVEFPLVTNTINLTQFLIGYTLQKGPLLRIEALFSPFKWVGHQSNALYNNLRPHAHVQYIYLKGSLGYTYAFSKNGDFSFLFRGQGATGPLLPSEQFILGGFNTVRGYREGDFIADNAFCLNLESRFYSFSVYAKGRDRMEPLVFTDFGWGYNYHPPDPLLAMKYIWSAGAGVRYNFETHFQFRLDYGVRLHHIFSETGFGRFHVSAVASY